MIFIDICSPCSAEYVKTFNAEKFRSQFPEAVDVIVNKHSANDLVSSFGSYEDALAICQNVIAIHAAAGLTTVCSSIRCAIKSQNLLWKDTEFPQKGSYFQF